MLSQYFGVLFYSSVLLTATLYVLHHCSAFAVFLRRRFLLYRVHVSVSRVEFSTQDTTISAKVLHYWNISEHQGVPANVPQTIISTQLVLGLLQTQPKNTKVHRSLYSKTSVLNVQNRRVGLEVVNIHISAGENRFHIK